MPDRGTSRLVRALRRLRTAVPALARCELCGEGMSASHGHVVDLHTRRVLCACSVCGTGEHQASGRYRLVPSRHVRLPPGTMSEARWREFDVPVDLAFFFYNSTLGRTVCLYPGAAGAVESLLPLDAWARLQEDVGALADVEALLVRRTGDGFLCYLVPIDVCYALVGRLRTAWKGMDGGDGVRTELGRFFAEIASKTAPEATLR